MIRWKTVSILSVIGMIPIGLALHASYVDYHTDLNIRTLQPIMAKHTNDVEGRINVAQHTADETNRKVDELAVKVDSLQISAAISAIAALNDELDRHERNQEDSVAWRKERNRLKRQIEQAKEYRECLINDRRNCELLRGW